MQVYASSSRQQLTCFPPNHFDDAHLLVDIALANAMYTTCATFHGGLMTTPGALSFGHDMVMDIPFVADLTLICDNCQRLIDENVICSNVCHHSYDYHPGQEVLKLLYKPDKLKPQDTIVLHTSGTLAIQLNARTTECISIRNVTLFAKLSFLVFIFIRFPFLFPQLNTCIT
jgi:hypothetical protein